MHKQILVSFITHAPESLMIGIKCRYIRHLLSSYLSFASYISDRNDILLFIKKSVMQRLTILFANYSSQIKADDDDDQIKQHSLSIFVNTTTKETEESVNLEYQNSKWWSINPDVVLAFGLIIFYAVFVLFILFIILRILVTICMTTTNQQPKNNKRPKINIRSEYGSESSSNSCRTGIAASHSLSMAMMMVDVVDPLRPQHNRHRLHNHHHHHHHSDLSSSFLDPHHHYYHHNHYTNSPSNSFIKSITNDQQQQQQQQHSQH
ncbi:hypothetical protein DERF_009512 [Dermatophagoides farinae]|uniref:Uncharacterized protein n=1 Tax=Dermatophagoides farinae TaxID=6954 RepID=A0A922L2M1_DERFA|nr:hypothetical protein DERF_009512 [Dermatophagoides farinae]